MTEFAIAVHGGAKPYSPEIDENVEGYERGIREALEAGALILSRGGSSLDAVQAAVMILEDNPLFNAGTGSEKNEKGDMEMDASIMEGASRKAGAVASVKRIKNPVSLAKAVMEQTSHLFLGGEGANAFAKKIGMQSKSGDYLKSFNQEATFGKQSSKLSDSSQVKVHGTVGAVAVDGNGNVAAATSTGGTPMQMEGRISDSSMIGVGCFADNDTCAVSVTGDGEIIIRNVVAHDISSSMEYRGLKVQEACDYVVHERNKDSDGDIGVIAMDRSGNIGFSFNSDCMIRGCYSPDRELFVKIFK
jgi:beta-aspartyl-peptidase (threonine type)